MSWRRGIRRSVVALAATVPLLTSPMAAAGCSSSQPSFDEAVGGAEAIALVSVEEVTTYGEPARGETYRVLEVLKGSLPPTVQLDDPRTSVCNDTVGLYAPEGSRAIVAFGVPFFGNVLHTVWVETADVVHPIAGSASVPDGVSTLAELQSTILEALPDTAMVRRGASPLTAVGIGILGLAVASAAVTRRWWVPR